MVVRATRARPRRSWDSDVDITFDPRRPPSGKAHGDFEKNVGTLPRLNELWI